MRGLARRMPVTMTCFAIASLGIAGLPLMAGFVSKFNLIRGILAMGQPFFAVVLVAAALLALSYLLPVVQIVFARGAGADGGPLLPAADDNGCGTARLYAECRTKAICAGADGGGCSDRGRWRPCRIRRKYI